MSDHFVGLALKGLESFFKYCSPDRTMSNIFWRKQQVAAILAKTPSQIFGRVLNAPLVLYLKVRKKYDSEKVLVLYKQNNFLS